MREFINRISKEENVILYIVELIYSQVDNIKKNKCLKYCLNCCCCGNKNIPINKYVITDSSNKNHLQLKSDTPIWHKENMINLGVQLLPSNWKAMAWIDADIEFDNNNWALDTLKILNGTKDIVQLFSHCVDMDKDELTMNIFSSFGFNFCKNKNYNTKGFDYWHSGYAWAITRKAYEKIGGLYDKGILGSGDKIIALAIINKVQSFFNSNYHPDYNQSMVDYQVKAKSLRLGYVPGIIRHYYHGTKKNRQYTERWQILIKHQYSPNLHLKYDSDGILVPRLICPPKLKEDIMTYFKERKEDE
jgi:hypothetical protein